MPTVDDRNPVFNDGYGVVIGAPTGGQLGPGTVNVQTGVFVNGNAVEGGLSVPNANLLGGNGSALVGITLGTNLSITEGVLNATGGGITLADLTALVAALPTSLPGTAGVLWLNGNSLQIS